MSKGMTTDVSSGDELPSELDEVAPAIRDVTYRLAHDLTDTPEDLRDAVAFAPLAAIKLAQHGADFLTKRPRRTLLSLAGLAVIVVGIALSWRNRPRPAA